MPVAHPMWRSGDAESSPLEECGDAMFWNGAKCTNCTRVCPHGAYLTKCTTHADGHCLPSCPSERGYRWVTNADLHNMVQVIPIKVVLSGAERACCPSFDLIGTIIFLGLLCMFAKYPGLLAAFHSRTERFRRFGLRWTSFSAKFGAKYCWFALLRLLCRYICSCILQRRRRSNGFQFRTESNYFEVCCRCGVAFIRNPEVDPVLGGPQHDHNKTSSMDSVIDILPEMRAGSGRFCKAGTLIRDSWQRLPFALGLALCYSGQWILWISSFIVNRQCSFMLLADGKWFIIMFLIFVSLLEIQVVLPYITWCVLHVPWVVERKAVCCNCEPAAAERRCGSCRTGAALESLRRRYAETEQEEEEQQQAVEARGWGAWGGRGRSRYFEMQERGAGRRGLGEAAARMESSAWEAPTGLTYGVGGRVGLVGGAGEEEVVGAWLEGAGSPPPKFHVAAGDSLPPGVRLDPATGALSCTLPASAAASSPFHLTIVAFNPAGRTLCPLRFCVYPHPTRPSALRYPTAFPLPSLGAASGCVADGVRCGGCRRMGMGRGAWACQTCRLEQRAVSLCATCYQQYRCEGAHHRTGHLFWEVQPILDGARVRVLAPGGSEGLAWREGTVMRQEVASGAVYVQPDGNAERGGEMEEVVVCEAEECEVLGSPFAVRGAPAAALAPCTDSDLGYPAPVFRVGEASALPPGLELDALTGELHGRPREVGSYKFVVVASNEAGSCSVEIKIEVRDPGPPVSFEYPRCVPGSPYVGLQYQVGEVVKLEPRGLCAADLRGRFVFSVRPALPAGLELDGRTGVISGVVGEAGAGRRYTVTGVWVSGGCTAEVRLKAGDAGRLPTGAGRLCSLAEGVKLQLQLERGGRVDALQGSAVRIAGGWKVRLDAGPQLLVDSGPGSQLTLFPLEDDFHLPSGAVIKAHYTYDYLLQAIIPPMRDPNNFVLTLRAAPWRLEYPEAVSNGEGRISNVIHLHQYVQIRPCSLAHTKCVCANFAVHPELPIGLTIDEDGVIAGTPLELSEPTEYVIMMASGDETWTASVAFAVEQAADKPRILAFYAQDKADALNVWGEAQQLESLMSRLGSFEVSMNVQPLFDDFREAVELCPQRNCRIVHMAGHGDSLHGFYFVTDRSGLASEPVDFNSIASILGSHCVAKGGPVECVVLNACNTEALGRVLRAEGVSAVVCWRWKVEDRAATAFSSVFYAQLDALIKADEPSSADERYRTAFEAGLAHLEVVSAGASEARASAARARTSCSLEKPKPANLLVFLSDSGDAEGSGNLNHDGALSVPG